MPFFTEHELVLPRADASGKPTDDNFFHSLPCPGGFRVVNGYMGDDDQKSFFYQLGWNTRGTALELGSFQGLSAVLFGLGMKHSPWQQGKLLCLDWFGDDPYLGHGNLLDKFTDNIKAFELEPYVTPIRGSCEEKGVIPEQPLEWIYFDASHCLKELRINMEIYGDWVKPGGFFIWHDTNQTDPPLAIEEARQKYGITPVVVRPDFQAWVLPH